MPVTGTALLIALSAVPGYLYLQLTVGYRRPEPKTALSEVFEILLVGLATTGLSVSALTLAFSDSAREVLVALLTTPAELSTGQLRQLILAGMIVTVVSLVLAWILSRVARRRARRRFSPSVLHATLGLVEAQHVKVVTMGMADGSTIDGVLHAYTLGDDEASRAIALKAPIRRAPKSGKVLDLGYDYLVLLGSDIKHIAVNQVKDCDVGYPEDTNGLVTRLRATARCCRRCWAESGPR